MSAAHDICPATGDLSVVIVNWNSKEQLRTCLDTICATCGEPEPKVIVVDGASFDGCGEMLAREYPEVDFIQSQENIGFGLCNNLGVTKVTTSRVLLLNPDTELRTGALKKLVQVLDTTPCVGVVSPRLLNTDGTLQTSCVQAFPTPLNQALDSEFLRRLFPASQLWKTDEAFRSASPVEVEMLSGACMLLKTETFRELGGFRKEFFMYGEDVDLCFRLKAAGMKCVFVPDAEVVHHGGCSSEKQTSGFSTKMMRVAGETFFRLNHGNATAARYRFLQGISALIRLTFLCIPLALSSGTRRSQLRESAQKWMTILRWAFGAEHSARRNASCLKFTTESRETSPFAERHIQAK